MTKAEKAEATARAMVNPHPCIVGLCVCVAPVGEAYCTVHRIDKEIKPSAFANGEWLRVEIAMATTAHPTDSRRPDVCGECLGSGECDDCDGLGTHSCHHQNCYDEHECQTCNGEGKCVECDGVGRLDAEIVNKDGVTADCLLSSAFMKAVDKGAFYNKGIRNRAKGDPPSWKASSYLRAAMLPVWEPPQERIAREFEW